MDIYPIINDQTRLLPLYLTSIGLNPNQERRCRPFGYRNHHMFIVAAGCGKVFCEEKEVFVQPGDAFFIKKETPHEYFGISSPFTTLYITYNGMASENLHAYFETGNFFFISQINTAVTDRFHEILKRAEAHTPELDLSQLLYTYVLSFLSQLNREKKKNAKSLEPAVLFMEKNFKRPFTLDQLAALCNMRKYTFCRDFKKAYAVTPFDYLLKLRIQHAKSLLANFPALSVKETAEQSGFHDTSYFCRIFKRFEYCTPGEFKQDLK